MPENKIQVKRIYKDSVFVELRVKMKEDLQIKYYLRGYHDCILLLLKCGLLK